MRFLHRRTRQAAFTLLALAAGPSQALVINASFGAGVDAAAQAVILDTIAGYQSLFSDPVTLGIRFENMTSGLGQSNTQVYQLPYASFISQLRADASSGTDAIAMAHIPLGGNPVNGAANMLITRATAVAVGFNVPAPASGIDSTISLNLGLMNYSRANIAPNKYDLQSITSHELNEVLGSISGVGGPMIFPADLYRYSNTGARSFTTLGDDAYFSLDGSTLLVRYNQTDGGDYGDFWSIGPHTVRVQDAFGTPGTFANLGVEITLLDAVGFNVSAVPEPAPAMMLLAGLGVLGFLKRRRR